MTSTELITLAEAARDAAMEELPAYAETSYDGWSYATKQDLEDSAQVIYNAVIQAGMSLVND